MKKIVKKSDERKWQSSQFLTDMRVFNRLQQKELAKKAGADGGFTQIQWDSGHIAQLETSFPTKKLTARGKHVIKVLGVNINKYLELVELDKVTKKEEKIEAKAQPPKQAICDELDKISDGICEVFKQIPLSDLKRLHSILQEAAQPTVLYSAGDTLESLESTRIGIQKAHVTEALYQLNEMIDENVMVRGSHD
jgi:hypothetical protein